MLSTVSGAEILSVSPSGSGEGRRCCRWVHRMHILVEHFVYLGYQIQISNLSAQQPIRSSALEHCLEKKMLLFFV